MPSIENVIEVMYIFESAPGALMLAKEYAGLTVSEDEEAAIFESNECDNDSKTESIVSNMSSEQLEELVKHLRLTNEEYKLSYGSDYNERVDDADIDYLLK